MAIRNALDVCAKAHLPAGPVQDGAAVAVGWCGRTVAHVQVVPWEQTDPSDRCQRCTRHVADLATSQLEHRPAAPQDEGAPAPDTRVGDRLREAAAYLRAVVPPVSYHPERTGDPDDVVHVARRGAPRWSWRKNVRAAGHSLLGRWAQWEQQLVGRPTPLTRTREAAWDLVALDSHRPESSLDEGNVLVFWSECTPFISTWTVPFAEATADMLEGEAVRADLLAAGDTKAGVAPLDAEQVAVVMGAVLAMADAILAGASAPAAA